MRNKPILSRLVLALSSILTAAAALPAAAGTPFSLWITETPAGGTFQFNNQLKGGVRSYTFDGLGYGLANVTVGSTAAASGLNDPSSVVFEASGAMLVANRGFNNGTGTVSRITFTAGQPDVPTLALTGLDTGPHQIALTGSGGLVVSSLSNGAKLYPGVSSPATVSYASGPERGAVVVGSRLYSAAASSNLQTFDLASGSLLGNFNVAGASLLHYGTSFGGALWFADVGANVSGAGGGIFKVTLDGIGNPLTSARVASVDGAISVSFSPDGDEMFVASHFAGTLTGYAVTGGIVAGSANLFIDGGVLPSWGGAHVQYGGMAVAAAVPEPATWALGLAGAAALCAWRRRRA